MIQLSNKWVIINIFPQHDGIIVTKKSNDGFEQKSQYDLLLCMEFSVYFVTFQTQFWVKQTEKLFFCNFTNTVLSEVNQEKNFL